MKHKDRGQLTNTNSKKKSQLYITCKRRIAKIKMIRAKPEKKGGVKFNLLIVGTRYFMN